MKIEFELRICFESQPALARRTRMTLHMIKPHPSGFDSALLRQ